MVTDSAGAAAFEGGGLVLFAMVRPAIAAHQALREAGWASALKVLAEEATVVLLACKTPGMLTPEDAKRLQLAVSRIENAKRILS